MSNLFLILGNTPMYTIIVFKVSVFDVYAIFTRLTSRYSRQTYFYLLIQQLETFKINLHQFVPWYLVLSSIVPHLNYPMQSTSTGKIIRIYSIVS
jgi:hypothetical protein